MDDGNAKVYKSGRDDRWTDGAQVRSDAEVETS